MCDQFTASYIFVSKGYKKLYTLSFVFVVVFPSGPNNLASVSKDQKRAN